MAARELRSIAVVATSESSSPKDSGRNADQQIMLGSVEVLRPILVTECKASIRYRIWWPSLVNTALVGRSVMPMEVKGCCWRCSRRIGRGKMKIFAVDQFSSFQSPKEAACQVERWETFQKQESALAYILRSSSYSRAIPCPLHLFRASLLPSAEQIRPHLTCSVKYGASHRLRVRMRGASLLASLCGNRALSQR